MSRRMMNSYAKREWVKLTVAEAYPVLCHADLDGCKLDPKNHKAGAPHPGPFYAPGASWYYTPEERFHVDIIADHMRLQGYTVSVGSESR